MRLLVVFFACLLAIVLVATSALRRGVIARNRVLAITAAGFAAVIALMVWAFLPADATAPGSRIDGVDCYVVPMEMPTASGVDSDGCYEAAVRNAWIATSGAAAATALVPIVLRRWSHELRNSAVGATHADGLEHRG